MNNQTFRAARAFLLAALPLCALAATAQNLRSSVTSFDKNGNPIIQQTSGDPTRSSVTAFDKQGNAIITYTSPPVPQDGKIVGQTPPNPNPGLYNRFSYSVPNYNYNYNYPPPGYGYPAYYPPTYAPAYPVQGNAYTHQFGGPLFPTGGSATVIPLTPGYAYPAPYPYPVPAYPYPVPQYGYPAPAYNYNYPAPYGYGYGTENYSSNSTGYGLTFGRGGFSASIGGNNTTSRSNTTFSVR